MGGKRTRAGKYVYLYITSLILLSLPSCAPLEQMKVKIQPQEEMRQHLLRSQTLLAQGDYEGALKENQIVLSLSEDSAPGDEALFNMGLIYAHYGNPKRDCKMSLGFFAKVVDDHPQSPLAEEAKIWQTMLQHNERLSESNEALNQLIKKLNQRIENSKRVTVKIQEREEARSILLRAQKLLVQKDYESALKENQKVLSLSSQAPPGDEALFNMGIIYAHSGNPKRDPGKSLGLFKRLMKDYPQSPFSEQAKILTGMLEENEKLNQTVEKLNEIIEKSKQVDIEIEEKKREKTK